MKAAVIVFPGTNCDRDTKRACEYFGWETEYFWHDEKNLDKYDIVFIPGGFSYGDYIRAGRLAKFSPAVMALDDYIQKKRGLVVGICNGFQILCERKLLPGILSVNDGTKFICDTVKLKPNQDNLGEEMSLPIAHGEGRYIADDQTMEFIKKKNMVFLQYQDNPNGSLEDIAGLYDRENRVIGMMPHPERAIFSETIHTDGVAFFKMLEKEFNY